ncbi:DNA repair protein [Phanerochaete sordida]|uniref:DNA repair protein REV1 n=1 Tax=Phanerochaete sordida TaxID=48140 RepID=A0A9P3G568_9APHY|nr:DNA repair protein [Phanerochaete sordida]
MSSSDYWRDDDPEFIAFLNQLELPGDVSKPARNLETTSHPAAEEREDPQLSRKRPRSPTSDEEADVQRSNPKLALVDENREAAGYLKSDTYGASSFGGFGEYMHRKRAKLQVQNAEMDTGGSPLALKSRIFSGVQIYINGWTQPSVQDLRQLIIQHGGVFHAYLDKKSLVTHIITCSLTPAKIKEFQHMKVARPEWLVQSVEAGYLLPWHDFIFKPGQRVEASQGRHGGQKSLLSGFVTHNSKPASQSSQSQRPFVETHLDSEPYSAASISVAGPSKSSSTPKLHEPLALPQEITLAVETSALPVAGPSTPPRTPRKSASAANSPRQLHTTDPATPEEAKRVPGYAADKTNVAAQRAMADPEWRAAHTSVAPDFIEGYYRNSRLHHLSTWKAELRNLVTEAQDRAEDGDRAAELAEFSGSQPVTKIVRENMGRRGWGADGADGVSMRGAQLVRKKGKGKERATDDDRDRIIMHCDFDSFFVAAGLVDRPHLRGKPVVVCHSQGTQGGQSSTSEIASASYEARQFGIRGGMSLQQARKLCPELKTMPYEFEKYKQLSLQFYTILMAHADDLQAVSVDEALIDVTSSVRRIRDEVSLDMDSGANVTDPAKDFAEAIRALVRNTTGCEVSIGISYNIMLARLATRRAKPGGSFHLQATDVATFLSPLDIDDLHGFGHSAHQKAQEKLGTTNLGELSTKSKAILCDALGKSTGETLYNALRGIDRRRLESDKPRKSVSCDINYGIRFEDNEQVETFMHQLAEEMSRRLDEIDMRGRSLTLKVLKRDPSAPVEAPKFMGHGLCESFTKQIQMVTPGGRATSDPRVIGEHAWRLIKGFNIDPKELRGIGIQVQKLEASSAATAVEQGQALLPFKPVQGSSKPKPQPTDAEADLFGPVVAVQPPSQDVVEVQESMAAPAPAENYLDLPSFSQVDMSVFQELPEDLRLELEAEYKRRTKTPDIPEPPKPARAASVPADKPNNLAARGVNVKRITRQLAPRSRASVSPTKNKLFAKQPPATQLKISEAELRTLNLDPAVFAVLPIDLQREQLAFARQKKATGGPGLALGGTKKVLKPVSRARVCEGNVVVPPPPPPQAHHPVPPTLKQQGASKGEKLHFTATDDVQDVIGAWVARFRAHPPNAQDVQFFTKFLVQCVDGTRSTDAGVEKAVAVMKWWLVLLRRHYAPWEDLDDGSDDHGGPGTPAFVGRAWWKAFRQVKEQLDTVARRKFGGCLSLR